MTAAMEGEQARRLMTLASQALGLEADELARRAKTASFTDLGGDSLLAFRLVARADRDLSWRVSVRALLDDLPLAQSLAAGELSSRSAVHGTGNTATPDLVPAQQGILMMDQLIGGSAYNLAFAAHIRGPLEATRLEEAVRVAVARHEMLRSCFPADGPGSATRREVITGWVLAIERVDLEGMTAPQVRACAQAVINAEACRPLEPGSRPPLRLLLLKGGGRRHVLILIVHHAVIDGWGVGLLFAEIFDNYAALASGPLPRRGGVPSPQILLTRQQHLEQAGEIERQLDYWRKTLHDVPTVLELPSDLPRPALQDPRGTRLPFELNDGLTAGVLALAGRCRTTPFTVFLAAYGLTLARYTGQTRLIIGIATAGRHDPEAEMLIAPCFSLVPVIIEVDDLASADSHIGRTRAALTAALDHADIPFHRLVHELGIRPDPRRNPLIQAVLSMHHELIPRRLIGGDLEITIEEAHGGGSPFDLTWFVQQAEPQFSGVLEFATAAMTVTEAQALLGSLRQAIRELAADGAAPLSHVRAITPGQRGRLNRLNARARRVPSPSTLESRFLSQVTATPDALAVPADDAPTGVTYSQLAHLASVQAQFLQAAGLRPGGRVAIMAPRSLAEIVAVLGTVIAGAAYVGIDASAPAERLRPLVGLADPAAIVADRKLHPQLRRLTALPILHPVGCDGLTASASRIEPARPAAERLAYVAFTSGSTGKPKGVAVPQGGVIRLAANPDYVRCGSGERFLRFAPLAFDASTLEIWAPLLNGGTIEVHPPGPPSPHELGETITQRKVTVLWLTAGLFRLMAESCPDAFATVRQLLTGGDVVPPAQVARLLKMHPRLRVTNGYGPTENTTFSTVHHVDHHAMAVDPLPIGVPICGTSAYILDEHARPVPPGAAGELFVGGAGLACGYIGDQEETGRCFGQFSPAIREQLYRTGDIVRIDGQGHLRFLGRRDDQVKIRGHRVEPEEVLQAVVAHPAVRDAAVLAVGDTSEERRLLAAIVPAHPDGMAQVRAYVNDWLPHFLRPSLWVELRSMPVNQNGKVDRAALEALAVTAAQAAPNRTGSAVTAPAALGQSGAAAESPGDTTASTRTSARAIFEEVLRTGSFEDGDNFFDLGGDSLSIARVVEIASRRHSRRIRLSEFYATPTVNRLVQLLNETR